MFFGYYPSVLNYDMSTGTQWGMMNIQMNQFWTDMAARRSLYSVPIYSFGNFYEYPTIGGGLDYLRDPGYYLSQWNSQNNSFALNAGNTNWWSGVYNNSSWNLFNPGQRSVSNTAQNPEDTVLNKRVNKLQNLLKAMLEAGVAGSKDSDGYTNLKSFLDRYTTENKTPQQKYDALKAEYDKLDKSKVRNFMSTKLKFDSVEISKVLATAGYEDEETDLDNKISSIVTSVSEIKDNSTHIQDNEVLGSLTGKPESSAYQILDVISSWNSKYAKDSNVDRNIIKFMAKKYNDKSLDTAAKATLYENGISAVTRALIAKATSVLGAKMSDSESDYALDADTRKAIKDLRDAVDSNLTNKDFAKLADNFDKLYVKLRIADTKIAQTRVNNYYGFLASSENETVFNKDLYMKETLEDLKNEGFTVNGDEVKINSSVVNDIEKSEDKKEKREDTVVNTNDPVSKQVESLNGTALSEVKDEETLAKLKSKLPEGVTLEGDIYLVNDPEKGDLKVVILKDGHLYELPMTYDGAEFKLTEGTNKETFEKLSTAKPADIEANYKKAVDTKTRYEAAAAKVADTKLEIQNLVKFGILEEKGGKYTDRKTGAVYTFNEVTGEIYEEFNTCEDSQTLKVSAEYIRRAHVMYEYQSSNFDSIELKKNAKNPSDEVWTASLGRIETFIDEFGETLKQAGYDESKVDMAVTKVKEFYQEVVTSDQLSKPAKYGCNQATTKDGKYTYTTVARWRKSSLKDERFNNSNDKNENIGGNTGIVVCEDKQKWAKNQWKIAWNKSVIVEKIMKELEK